MTVPMHMTQSCIKYKINERSCQWLIILEIVTETQNVLPWKHAYILTYAILSFPYSLLEIYLTFNKKKVNEKEAQKELRSLFRIWHIKNWNNLFFLFSMYLSIWDIARQSGGRDGEIGIKSLIYLTLQLVNEKVL